MYKMLDKITKGEGEKGDIDKLVELGESIKKTALCGLGQTAPNPVLSTIKYFRNEYRQHIENKKCSAMVCTDLLTYTIDPDKCKACTLCAQNCPVDCIDGERGVVHEIREDECIKCGNCYDVCPFDAVIKTTGELE
jgi:NAD-dependent dihydropyrimidine dehydrogenase PreA subunit